MNVLLCSVGRRPYLVEWFKEAQESTGSNGLVVAADADPYAPSQAFADVFELAPLVSDPDYPEWLAETLGKHDIGLALSVNDFELSKWAELANDACFDPLLRLSPELQAIAEDKLVMYQSLSDAGINAPETWLLSTALDKPDLLAESEQLVLKGRYGSASRGLRFVTPKTLREAAQDAFSEVTGPSGSHAESFEEAVDLMVVQLKIVGQEFGLDVVNDLGRNFAGVLARKKIKMRFGETDQALSVPPYEFEGLGAAVSVVTRHQGLIDTDVMVDSSGKAWLIDLNPRFGGGYPFSHLAGADVPAAYLSWCRLEKGGDSLSYDDGVRGAKAVSVVEVAI